MTNNIHPTAIIEEGAKLGNNVTIGPFSIVGKDVTLGDNVELKSHVVITGLTSIGEGTVIFPFAAIGHVTQDKKYQGEVTQVIIGKNTTIREYVTVHPGTAGGGLITRVGDNCLLMIACHVAHDCKIGNNVILVNNATLGGHVEIDDFAIVGGMSAVHQFVKIGAHAMIGGMSAIESDVIPYGMAVGERANLAGLNIRGLKRREFSRETIHALRNAYDIIFNSTDGTFEQRIQKVADEYKDEEQVIKLVEFLRSNDSRPICKPKVNS
jgi:UDP-N-acetylglucosamine acyltransferase